MTRPGALHRPRPFVYQEQTMPQVRFIKSGWGHNPGDVAEFAEDFVVCMVQEGVAVRVDEQPKVERAVAPEAKKETANLKR